ncbi:hypothetical protein HP550_14875 [Cellulomonas humilata]|uniref:Uncharacterized protein n=1 Tax=Cellulomonas humilata TaxID=144055 RepID=A0A7Y6A2J6_9CELL|nr:hypothetical protein [Cellulomonas humilata]NUU18537.1 hypothetical protein [Cellulomonas humilata]
MGEPDERPQPIDVRLLRTRDLIDLRLEAPGCTIEPTDGGAELVAGPDASLVVHFPPQHLGEQIWDAGAPPPPPPVPGSPSRHIVSGPTRLVYAVPEGTRIGYTLEGVLEALPGLTLRVSPLATPTGETTPDERGAEPPTDLETAIEAPYHLVVSPSERGAFRHSATAVGPDDRAELWRTHLTVRRADGSLDDTDPDQRIVRALWNRDSDVLPPLFEQPLTTFDRDAFVEQTHGGRRRNADKPLLVSNLALSSLGAWFDWRQSWDLPADVVDYRHQAFMGRDGYVRVAYPGFLFPFGHRCYLVKVTEREIKHRATPVAYLWQRWFILVRQPTRTYPRGDRDNPFGQVTVSPLVTPDIDKPPADFEPFVPTRNTVPFPFTLTTVDRGGETRTWSAPLVFVRAGADGDQVFVHHPDRASSAYFPVRQIQGRGQTLALAKPVKAGDTSVEAGHLIFDGEVDVENVTSRPFLTELRAVVPSMRHLSPQAPAVDLVYAKPYLLHGLPDRALDARPVPGAANAGELVLALKSLPAAVDFSSGSDRAGGFVAPNLSVQGISRALGAIGESGKGPSPFDAGAFDPATFLSGALPKLFGLFSLTELLEVAGFDEAPAFVSDALDAVTKLLTEARRLRTALADAQARLAAEVAGAAHGGAQAVAQQAKDALDARVGATTAHLDALVSAVQGLPGTPEAVSSAAVTLAADLQPLLDAIGLPGFPAAVRSSLATPVQTLRTLTDLAKDAAGLAQLLEGVVGGQVTARLSWRPTIKAWGLPPTAPEIFKPKPDSLHIDVEVRASASAPPAVDVVAEIVDFDLNLIGNTDTALMKLMFRRIGFHAGSSGKPEVDVVFGGMGFLGPLAFVDRLRELIPFDGFSDPPYVDVAPDGVTAGFDLTLPNVSVGVFSLENIALGADARIPFLGDAMTVGFHFCSKDAPFRLTVMCVGGGGWLALRAAPKGLVLLELGLEACASLSVDLGVASGSVSIAVGVYLRLEADKGLFTAYFRIRGEVDVLGLISASITLELSLTYHFQTGKLIGRASLVVEIEILFFSASVEISVERKLAGSKGDPTMFQVMPPDAGMNADWALYCDAFAPVPA